MSILSVIDIFRLCTVAEIVLCNKVCSTNIAVCLIELTVNNICNNLLTAVPDMIDCLTVYSFLITQTADIVSIACSCLAISKANELIQSVVGVSLSLTFGSLCNLIAVSVVGINRLLNAACKVKRIFFRFYSLGFLLKKGSVVAIGIAVAVNSGMIFSTACCHLGAVAIVIVLVSVGISCVAANCHRFLSQSLETVILVLRCFYYTIFITHFASVRTIKIIRIFIA